MSTKIRIRAGQAARRGAEDARASAFPSLRSSCTAWSRCWPGRRSWARVIGELESALRGACDLDLRTCTNGVLLDGQTCELLAEPGVKVSISLKRVPDRQ